MRQAKIDKAISVYSYSGLYIKYYVECLGPFWWKAYGL